MSKPSKFAGLLNTAPVRVESPEKPVTEHAEPPATAVRRNGPGRPAKKNPKYKDPRYKPSTLILGRDAYADAYYRMAKEGIHDDVSALTTWLLQEYGKAPIGSVPHWINPKK